MARAVAFVFIAIACLAITARADNPQCGAVLEGLLGSAKCAARAQPTFDNAGKAAAGQCGSAQAAIGDVDAECCPGLRQLVTSGCVCDNTFIQTLQTLAGLPDIPTATSVARGTSALTQAGPCSSAANGGKISDPCGVASC